MQQVFIVGIDGATLNLIEPLVAQGGLPNFERLIKEGGHGKLESVPNQRSAAAWTSLMTGKNPGKHGIFEFYDYIPGTYEIQFVNGCARQAESLWGNLSRQGKKVIVINVPMTYPAEAVNGILIAGLDAPGAKSKGFMYPPELSNELTQRYGDYIIEPGVTGSVVKDDIDDALNNLYQELDQKFTVTDYLMGAYPWDCFMIVFRSLDAVQHCFWKYMDPRHPGYSNEGNRLYGNVIDDVYKRLDSFIGQLLAKLDDRALFMIVSDHGFGPKHRATSQLNLWLESKGYLHRNGTAAAGLLQRWLTRYLAGIYREIVGRTSRRLKEKLVKFFPVIRDRVQSRLIFAGIDWQKTRAYTDNLFPNIRINLKGREPLGIVPESDYRELINALKSDIKACCDQKTGEPIVEAVLERDAIYTGPWTQKAPDLLVRWREDIFINGIRIENSRFQTRAQADNHPPIPGEDPQIISGDHQLDGILFLKGPNIKPGCRIDNASIMDVAPTVLYHLQCPIGEDMDGKVLSGAITDSYLATNAIIRQSPSLKPTNTSDGHAYTGDDEEVIAERLRNLGYLE